MSGFIVLDPPFSYELYPTRKSITGNRGICRAKQQIPLKASEEQFS
jgi:hypothetical protein